MRAAERREEVVERVLVGDVDGGQAEAPLVSFAVEEIVFTNGGIEEAARRNARWILVIVLRARCGDADKLRGELRGEARVPECLQWVLLLRRCRRVQPGTAGPRSIRLDRLPVCRRKR